MKITRYTVSYGAFAHQIIIIIMEGGGYNPQKLSLNLPLHNNLIIM